MKPIFARTGNVSKFVAAMGRLHSRQADIPGMALVFGEPGLGKTKTALWWQAQNDAVFVRTKKLMTGRWLLEEVVAELGEAPAWKTSDLWRQCVDQLMGRPRTLIFDEVDYLSHDARIIETLRDIHDMTGVPVIFIGMAQADKKLMRYRHLYDRFSEVVKFGDLTEDDVRIIAETMCEVKLAPDAVSYIYGISNRFRKLLTELYRCESISRASNLKIVTARELKK